MVCLAILLIAALQNEHVFTARFPFSLQFCLQRGSQRPIPKFQVRRQQSSAVEQRPVDHFSGGGVPVRGARRAADRVGDSGDVGMSDVFAFFELVERVEPRGKVQQGGGGAVPRPAPAVLNLTVVEADPAALVAADGGDEVVLGVVVDGDEVGLAAEGWEGGHGSVHLVTVDGHEEVLMGSQLGVEGGGDEDHAEEADLHQGDGRAFPGRVPAY